MMKKAFAAVALAGMAMSAQATVVINEGFTDVAALSSKGWISFNKGTPGGPDQSPGWVQGAATAELFNAQAGAPNSYASASYNIAPEGGFIDSWLITSQFDASKGANISFYLRAAGGGFADQLTYGFVDAAGNFNSAVRATVNPVPDNAWTRYNIWIAPQNVGLTRLGFEYTGTNESANYIGLDSLVVDVPEPASMALLAALNTTVRILENPMSKLHFIQRLLGTGAAVALCAIALPASAQEAQQAVQSADAITVTRDATTGKLRAATADEQAALKAAKAKLFRAAAVQAPLQKFHSSGARGARLTDEFMSSSVAVRQADGSIATECHETHGGTETAGHVHVAATNTPVTE
jgi:hypothetical protein